ncbi:MAG: ComEA family DNA-binding protein [Candidatus Dojkabacteria bacterium]
MKGIKKILKVIFYLFLLTILVTLLIGLGITFKDNFDGQGNLVFLRKEPDENYIFKSIAYVSGQINSPGVYEVEDNSRVSDLINKAGGFSTDADLDYIAKNVNLSEKLKDEQHIYIPSIAERGVSNVAGAQTDSSVIGGKVNINTASKDALDALPGVGPSTADKIIAARPYESIEDLKDVSGIGDAKFDEIKDLIDVK